MAANGSGGGCQSPSEGIWDEVAPHPAAFGKNRLDQFVLIPEKNSLTLSLTPNRSGRLCQKGKNSLELRILQFNPKAGIWPR